MERVLFLDVDGVLNFHECWSVRKMGAAPVAPECVEQLDRVCETTGARVVLSSAWREMPTLERKLRDKGALKHRRKSDWRTKRLVDVSEGGIYLASCRGDEIAEWLSRHPEVTEYAIVDDSSDMLPEQLPRFVQTSFTDGGLTSAHADRLISLFTTHPHKGDG